MQWEFAESDSHQQGNSYKPLSRPEAADASETSAPMDISAMDDSMRDVSMAQAEPAEENITQIEDDSDVQEISRPATNDEGSASSAPAAASSSSALLLRSPGSRRRRRRSSSASSASTHSRSNHQWPISPIVGTVINYLVPPVTTPSSQGGPILQGQESNTNGPSTTSAQTVQRAKDTLHPRERPLLLLSYAQLTFNASLLLIALYLVFALVWTIRLDVVERLREVEDAYHHSVSACQRSFDLNCLAVPIPPALHSACAEWERCSQRRFKDVLGGSRLRVVIEVLSEAWEAGVAGLGWRTLGFSLLLLSVFVGGTNSTLNSWRLGVAKRSKARQNRGSHYQDDDDDDDGKHRLSSSQSSRRRGTAQAIEHVPSTPLALPYPTSPYSANDSHYQQQYAAAAAFLAASQQQQQQQHQNAQNSHLLPQMFPQQQSYGSAAYPTTPSSRRSRVQKSPKRASFWRSAKGKGEVLASTSSNDHPQDAAEEWIDDDEFAGDK